MAIQSTLKKLGLNEKEIRIYLTLLKNGKTKPSVLAKLTKINRTTLYSLANELASRGLIAEDMSNKTMEYVPLAPEELKNILEPVKREIKEKEDLIAKAIGELSLIGSEKSYPVPKMRFVEEKDIERFLFASSKKWLQALGKIDNTWWGFQDHTFVENYEKWLDAYWKMPEAKSQNHKVRLLSQESLIEKKVQKKYPKDQRLIRSLDDMDFTATVWVCGDYLVIIETNKHPYYLFEIHDSLLAHNMREMFKKLWAMTHSLSKINKSAPIIPKSPTRFA